MSMALEIQNLSKRYGRTWALRDCTVTLPAGHFISDSQIGQACSVPALTLGIPLPLNFPVPFNCTHAHGWLQTITWQPVDRVWLFQGIESAIFFGLAAGLLVLTYWWIRERIS